jgi:uncharacterized protein
MPKVNIKDRPDRKDRKSRLISLTVTSTCNLDCTYCYEKHDLRDKKIMDVSIAKESICYYMEEEGTNFVEIDFFGGEPLLAFEMIRDVVDWFHTRTWKKQHHFMIGTNGTILNEEIKEWLYKNRGCLNVGLSIDGTKIAHDLCRSNSYDAVLNNLPFFQTYWPQQPAKMTICADTIPYVADGVIELEQMGLLFTANIGFEDQWGDETNKEKLLEIYEKQLSRLIDFYLERPHLYPVSLILTSVPEYLGIPNLTTINEMKKNDIKRFCGAGHEMVIIDVDGSKYPCHRFIPWITKKPVPEVEINCQTAWKPEKCSKCKLHPSCPTCAGFNWEINGETGIRSTFHCEFFKREVMASCILEWKRLHQKNKSDRILTIEDKRQVKRRIDAILELIDNGF